MSCLKSRRGIKNAKLRYWVIINNSWSKEQKLPPMCGPGEGGGPKPEINILSHYIFHKGKAERNQVMMIKFLKVKMFKT